MNGTTDVNTTPIVMERVLYNLHYKVCHGVLQHTSNASRRWMERFWLVLFSIGFCGTLLLHVSFVHQNGNSSSKSIPTMCLTRIPGFSLERADVTLLSLDTTPGAISRSWIQTAAMNEAAAVRNSSTACATEQNSTILAGAPASIDTCRAVSLPNSNKNATHSSSSGSITTYFAYAPHAQGFLYLSEAVLLQHGLTMQHVIVSSHDERCLGRRYLRDIVLWVTGPETVLVNWILGAQQNHRENGYLWNTRTQTRVDLGLCRRRYSNNWYSYYTRSFLTKGLIVTKTSFLFFLVTTLVSFILRETQERMLVFTQHLQRRVRQRQGVTDLVLTHLVENLVFVPIMVGMVFFHIEIYRGDKVAALLVLTIVWVCEAFTVVR